MGIMRRDFGVAGLYDLPLTPLQTVAAATMTLFDPCIASLLMVMKERGKAAGLASPVGDRCDVGCGRGVFKDIRDFRVGPTLWGKLAITVMSPCGGSHANPLSGGVAGQSLQPSEPSLTWMERVPRHLAERSFFVLAWLKGNGVVVSRNQRGGISDCQLPSHTCDTP